MKRAFAVYEEIDRGERLQIRHPASPLLRTLSGRHPLDRSGKFVAREEGCRQAYDRMIAPPLQMHWQAQANYGKQDHRALMAPPRPPFAGISSPSSKIESSSSQGDPGIGRTPWSALCPAEFGEDFRREHRKGQPGPPPILLALLSSPSIPPPYYGTYTISLSGAASVGFSRKFT